MNRLLPLLLSFLWILSPNAIATDRFYRDIESKSPSARYVVTAQSPENQPGKERKAFQSSFTYTCTDTTSGKILWTRKQPMGEPEQVGNDPAYIFADPKEGSPSSIYLSDLGNTVIYTGWQELIIVDITGKVTGQLDVLKDGLTKEENENYVDDTTAGPIWQERSLWHFVSADAREFFVIRPWWGRNLYIDLSTGKFTKASNALKEATAHAEKTHVIRMLQGVLDGKVEKCDCCDGPHQAAFAAYLAGVLKIQEVIPALRKLEEDSSSGSSTLGGFDDLPEGSIHPHNYSTYDTRQTTQLALRRLGEKPGPFPCTSFKTEHKDYHKMKTYVREPIAGSRHVNAKKIKKGMSPKEVINLIDCPDYIPDRTWQYDIDDDEPYTLTVSWNDQLKVKEIEIIRPALWKKENSRDR